MNKCSSMTTFESYRFSSENVPYYIAAMLNPSLKSRFKSLVAVVELQFWPLDSNKFSTSILKGNCSALSQSWRMGPLNRHGQKTAVYGAFWTRMSRDRRARPDNHRHTKGVILY